MEIRTYEINASIAGYFSWFDSILVGMYLNNNFSVLQKWHLTLLIITVKKLSYVAQLYWNVISGDNYMDCGQWVEQNSF